MKKTTLSAIVCAILVAINTTSVTQSTPSSKLGNPDRGLALFSAYCASCHGDDGRGDGPLAARLGRDFNAKPTNFSNPTWQSSRTDANLIKIIQGGSKGAHRTSFMPAWGLTLNPNEVKDIAAFVRELGNTPNKFPVGSTIDIQKQLELGRVLYSLQCLACHGRNGKGDGPLLQASENVHPPDFSQQSYFRNVSNAQLEEWAQSGAVHAKLGIDPSQHTWWHQGLDEKEVEAVLLYLRTLPLKAASKVEQP